MSKYIEGNGRTQLTAREQFAMAAMQAIISNQQCLPLGCSFSEKHVAALSFSMADAMIAASGVLDAALHEQQATLSYSPLDGESEPY